MALFHRLQANCLNDTVDHTRLLANKMAFFNVVQLARMQECLLQGAVITLARG
jgi:hypothetical protein